jgi:MFS family permease
MEQGRVLASTERALLVRILQAELPHTFTEDCAMKRRLRSIGINRQVAILSSARAADAFGNSLLIVVLPLYVVQLPRTGLIARLPEEALIGILISLAGLMFALMQPLAATISDRTGHRKPLILLGLAILAVATLGYIPARSFVALVALRIIQGFGIALTVPTALALISAYSEEGKVGAAMGVFSTARMVGFTVGPLAGGFLLQYVSFRAAFIAGAIGALVGLVAVLIFVPEVRGEETASGSTSDSSGNETTKESPPSAGASPERARAVWRQLYILGIAVFVMAVSISLMASVEPELNRRLGQTAVGFGLAFSMLTVGRFLVQIPVGHWSDHIGRKPLLVAGLIATIPLTVLQGYAPTTFWLSADRFLLGVSTAMMVAPGYAMVVDLALPGMLVRQMSLLTMSFGFGVAVGPMLSGLLAGVAGFEVPFLVGGAGCLVATVLVSLFVRESYPKEKRLHARV